MNNFNFNKKFNNKKHIKKFNKILTTVVISVLFVGCATKRDVAKDIDLKTGYARIQFELDNHLPHLFQERLYGYISSLKTKSGQPIEVDPEGQGTAIRYIDVMPGTYKLQANCEPVNNHSGYQYNWLANHTLTLEASQVVTLGCEYYREDNPNDLVVDKKKKREKARKVRVAELRSDYIE